MLKPIVVVGSINLDLVASADHIPKPGETIIGSNFQTFHGGKGANQAVAAGKLGHPTYMVGNVGDDPFGAELRQALMASRVNTDAVDTVQGSSGVALITIGSGGENNIVVVPGANGLLSPDHLKKAAPILRQAGFLLAQLEIPLETVEYLARFAEQQGIPIMLDPAPARDLPPSLLEQVEWLTPNESETEILLKRDLPMDDDKNILAAAGDLLALGPRNVLLKLGARGCLIAESGRQPQFVPAFPVNAIDSTAAGDAFNAAFAVGLLRGRSAVDSARYACAVAAISVSRAGAQPSMPTLDEVTEFLSSYTTSSSETQG